MSDNLILPSWLSRGIEEYFPIKGTNQTFSEIIDHAKKNNKNLRAYLYGRYIKDAKMAYKRN